jgi:hypothetical protein
MKFKEDQVEYFVSRSTRKRWTENKGQQNAIDRFHRDPDPPIPLVSKTLSSKQTTETKPITPAT